MTEHTTISTLIKLSNNIQESIMQNIERIRSFLALNFPELQTKLTNQESFLDFIDKSGCNFEQKVDEYPEISDLFSTTVGHPLSEEDKGLLRLVIKEIQSNKAEKVEIDKTVAEHINTELTALVTLLGESFTVKLLGEHSSLKKLAFLPSTSIQIMGAERSLQTAIRNKKNTPKFGVIYNAGLLNLVRTKKDKGKLARTLASKITLCAKLDYWKAEKRIEIALDYVKKIKNRARNISQAKKKNINSDKSGPRVKTFNKKRNFRK